MFFLLRVGVDVGLIFFFKQKTAYEMRISDWSSDVCSSDLGDIDPEWAPNPEELPRWFVDALAVPRDEGFVEVDGTRIHYFRWGRRGAPPVLMTHGFLAHARSEEHTSELQSLMRISYAVFCLKKTNQKTTQELIPNRGKQTPAT